MSTSTASSIYRKISPYKTVIRPVLFSIGLIFFIILIVRSWSETQSILKTLHWPFFSLSILIALTDNLLFSILFQQLIAKYGFHIEYPKIGQMFFYGQMAKYIPGRFWSVIYHATFLQRLGATKVMLFANLDLTVVSMLRNIVIAITLSFFHWNIFLAFGVAILGTGLFWFFSKSCWILQIFNTIFNRNTVQNNTQICHDKIDNRIIILISILNWATFLTANFLVMQSAFGFKAAEATPYIAYFGIAWVVGVLSFIVPAGIGIREITFICLAQAFNKEQVISVETLTAIAIVYRFWQVVLEFGSLGIGLMLSKLQKSQESVKVINHD